MALDGQWANQFWLYGWNTGHTWGQTVAFNESFVLAEIALTGIATGDADDNQASCAITQIISNNNVENFDMYSKDAPVQIARDKATSITFGAQVYEAAAIGRWVIFFWS